MKPYFYSFCIVLLLSNTLFSQIIIGDSTLCKTKPCDNTNIILHINSENQGVSLPTVSLTNRNSPSPIHKDAPKGTLIYNTNTFGDFPHEVIPGLFWWDGENGQNQWNPMAANFENFTAKFSNVTSGLPVDDNDDDYYQNNPIKMKIFGSTVFNEKYDALEVINDKSLKFNYSGLYAISVNLALNKYAANPAIGIKVNLALDSLSVGSSHYIRSSSSLDKVNGMYFSNSFTEYIEVKENQTLTILSKRATLQNASTYQVNFDSPGSSSITISRIR